MGGDRDQVAIDVALVKQDVKSILATLTRLVDEVSALQAFKWKLIGASAVLVVVGVPLFGTLVSVLARR
jgi:hypothetical protein